MHVTKIISNFADRTKILKLIDYFFAYFCNAMKWTRGFISRWRKGDLRLFRYENVKVAILNDYDNRRVLVWYFYEPTRKIMRVAYHGYHVRYLANKVAYTVRLIQTDDKFREFTLFQKRSYSYKAEARQRIIRGK